MTILSPLLAAGLPAAGLPAAGVTVGDIELSTQVVLALLPLALLLLALAVYALVDLVRAPSVRYLPKPVWAVIILLVSSPFGALAYLVFGRNRDGARPAELADLSGPVSVPDRGSTDEIRH